MGDNKQQTTSMFHKQQISSKERINLNLVFVSRLASIRCVIYELGSLLSQMMLSAFQNFLSRMLRSSMVRSHYFLMNIGFFTQSA